jgi:hypothetical protein
MTMAPIAGGIAGFSDGGSPIAGCGEGGHAGNDDAAASPAPAMVDRLSSVLARVDRETGGENRLPLQGREAV